MKSIFYLPRFIKVYINFGYLYILEVICDVCMYSPNFRRAQLEMLRERSPDTVGALGLDTVAPHAMRKYRVLIPRWRWMLIIANQQLSCGSLFPVASL